LNSRDAVNAKLASAPLGLRGVYETALGYVDASKSPLRDAKGNVVTDPTKADKFRSLVRNEDGSIALNPGKKASEQLAWLNEADVVYSDMLAAMSRRMSSTERGRTKRGALPAPDDWSALTAYKTAQKAAGVDYDALSPLDQAEFVSDWYLSTH